MNKLKTVSLTKIYQPDIIAVEDFSYEIKEKEIVIILGPSGSGKSTLLNMLALLDKPTKGEILYNGEDITNFSEKEAAYLRNTTFGFIFQFFNLIPELNILENIFLPLWIKEKKHNISYYREKALGLLKEFRLEQKLNSYPNQLSGGEKQKISICRSLICNPDIIFADEPTGNLDKDSSEEVIEMIRQLNKNTEKTFVIATHNENFLKIASKVVYLKNGKIINTMIKKGI
jgi:ABC-type lipoprotein export system ATPase subunit